MWICPLPLARTVSRTSVPRSYSDYAYNLRTHIEVVRTRMLRMARAEQSAPTKAA